MGLHRIKWVNTFYIRELTAKETTIEEVRIAIKNSALDNVVFCIRKQFFYFAPLASFAVRLYRAQMTHSIRGRATRIISSSL